MSSMPCPLRSPSKRRNEEKFAKQFTEIGQGRPRTESEDNASNSSMSIPGQGLPRRTQSERLSSTVGKERRRPLQELSRAHTTAQRKPAKVRDKAAIAKLTSQALREVIPEFDPSSYQSPRRNAYADAGIPEITVSDESGLMQNISSGYGGENGPLKPMPSIPEVEYFTSTRQRSDSSMETSSTQSSQTLSVPSATKPSRKLSKRRSTSLESKRSSFSGWSRPSSVSSLLPAPLRVSKESKAKRVGAQDQSFEEQGSSSIYQNVREMYSYEELDYQALLDEVCETPSQRIWRKLPFKRKSNIDHAHRPLPNAADSREAPGTPAEHASSRPASASTAGSRVTTSRHASPLHMVESALEPSTSVTSDQSTTTRFAGTQTSRETLRSRSDKEVSATSAERDHTNSLADDSPAWRKHIPTQCRHEDSTSRPVRTASGSRILQLREAVYDDEGKIVYKPLTFASMEADDATRLFVLPMSSSSTDVIDWSSPDTSSVVRGAVCLGRDITGATVKESVVWSGKEDLDLEGIEQSLRRSEIKRLTKARTSQRRE